jgi:hypothetical protein
MIPYQSPAEYRSIMVPAQFSLSDIAINSTSPTSFAYKLRNELPTSLQKLAEQNPNPRHQVGNLLFMLLLRVVFKYQRPICAHPRKQGTSQGTTRIHRWSWQTSAVKPSTLSSLEETASNCRTFRALKPILSQVFRISWDDNGRVWRRTLWISTPKSRGNLENRYLRFTTMLMIGIVWRRQ